MELRFGRDLGHVRIHTDALAAESAGTVQALAFTVGHHVVFGADQYRPQSDPGKKLLTHELTHTIQQDPTHIMPGATAAGPVLQRQPAPARPAKCSVEVCFVPIKRYGLGIAGLKHAVLNVEAGQGETHVEVDPDFHQAKGMLHSHVVHAKGHKSGEACHSFASTCADASKVLSAAREYESRDAIYDPFTVTGPNSNSFAEWALTRAGLNTASVSVPMGASGWDYFSKNSAERTDPPHVLRAAPTAPPRSSKTQSGSPCKKIFQPARDTTGFVALVRQAEANMSSAGISGNSDKIKILRGLYYGTPWSVDFAHEKSPSRIAGFQTFTTSGSKFPRDPVSLFDCGLYQALQLSQDVASTGGPIDVGHLMIGLDARNATVAGVSTPNLPIPGFGGTGLELVTWVGDLGGGAGKLALDRARAPKTPPSVSSIFSLNKDYGAASNLEGDVAGFLVARGSSWTGADAPSIPPGKGIADALDDYFASPKAPSTGWRQRAKTFLAIYGGLFDVAGSLTNASKVIKLFAGKIESFACTYLAQRKVDSSSKIPDAQFIAAADNIRPCAQEASETFVDTLVKTSKSTATALKATPPFPTPRPPAPGACGSMTTGLRVKKALGGWLPFGGDK
jgi:hypothetical protein